MAITQISLSDYRNIKQMTMSPTDGINLLYGANGQGKTNLLEAIWMFTGMPSFRDAKLKDCIRFGSKHAVLEMESENTSLQKAKLVLGEEKKYIYNGVGYQSMRKVAGYFRCVVFAPNHLFLFHEGPKARRELLNQMIAQLRPNYAAYLSDYEKLILNRNALLRDYKGRNDLPMLLEPWDLQLSQIGTWLTVYRTEYVNYLSQYIGPIYEGLSGGKEKLTISYQSTVFGEEQPDGYRREYAQQYYDALQNTLSEDLFSGHTGIGAHRDDLEFLLDGLPVKSFGSQGQQRSVIIALKLAEAELIHRLTGERPVILLDDVMSELDVSRQNYILNKLDQTQVFITCCDPANTMRLKAGRIFSIREGALQQEIQAGEESCTCI